MKCPKCGKEIADDSVFCENCGKKINMSNSKKMRWIVLSVVLSLSVTGIVIGFIVPKEQISPEGEVSKDSIPPTLPIDSLRELSIVLDSINPTELGVLSDSVIYYKKDSSYYFINKIGQPLVKGKAFDNFTLKNNVIITELKRNSTESKETLYQKERRKNNAKKVKYQSVYGIVSLNGDELVPCESEKIEHPTTGVHTYKIGSFCGCVSDTSSILKCKYKVIKYGGKENVLLCQKDSNSLYYFYDTRGKQILPNEGEKGYYYASAFSNEVALVGHYEKNAGYFIDINGKEIWSPVEAGYVGCGSFYNKKAIVFKNSGGNVKYGLIDENYREVLPCLYDDIEEIEDNAVVVNKDGEWKIVSYNQKEIAVIRSILHSSTISKYFIITRDKDNTYSLYLNNILFQNKLDYIYLYSHGKCAEIKKNGQYQLVNSSGKVSLPYSNISSYEDGKVFKVRNRDGYYGLIDSDFNILVECKFEYIGSYTNGILAAKQDSLYGYINKKGDWILSPAYSDAKDLKNSELAIVKYEKGYGIIKTNKDIILPFNYDNIVPHSFNSSLYLVCKNNRFGLFDVNKKSEIVPCEFENDFKHISNYLFPVKKNGKWGIYTRDGRSTFDMNGH